MPTKQYFGVKSLLDLFGSKIKRFVSNHLDVGEPDGQVFNRLLARYPDGDHQALRDGLSLVKQSKAAADGLPLMGPADTQPSIAIPVQPGAKDCEYEIEVYFTDPETDQDMVRQIRITSDHLLTWSEIYALARDQMESGTTFYWRGEKRTLSEDVADISVIPIMVWGC